MAVKIITDSTSDIPFSMRQVLNIEILPLSVIFGDEVYIDGVDLNADQLYEKMETTGQIPRTSQVTPVAFQEAFSKAVCEGYDVVCILISSTLSGTFQSAMMAKEQLSADNIYIIDSKTVSMGLGILVREAVKLRDSGKTAGEIFMKLESIKNRVHFYAIVDNVKYLKMGGRLSSTGALVATVLNIKPVVEVREGIISAVAKVRGLQNGYEKILEIVLKTGVDASRLFCLGHTNCKEKMNALKETLEKKLTLRNILLSSIGTIVGVHGGPGCTGISFFGAK